MISNDAEKTIQLQAIADEYAGQTLEIWSGAVPSNPDDVPAGTKLVSITLPTPAFTLQSATSLSKSGTWKSNSILATGTPTFFRLIGSTARRQGSAAMNSGAELVLTNSDNPSATELLQNLAVEITSYTITQS